MKFRLASDIHTEFFGEDEIADLAPIILPPLEDDKDTFLLLAGDIGANSRPESLLNFIDAVAPRFPAVFYIAGNHEHYSGDIRHTKDRVRKLLAHHDNLFFTTDGGAIMPSGQTLHLHTLWTDFDKENPISMNEARYRMNDYRVIANGDDILQPEDTLAFHKAHLKALNDLIKPGDIVVTHHSPSLKSIPEEYLTDRVNGAYHSDLSGLILEKKPAVWCHGHTHTAIAYELGDTKVICNPRGYGNQYRKNGYNPILTFEV